MDKIKLSTLFLLIGVLVGFIATLILYLHPIELEGIIKSSITYEGRNTTIHQSIPSIDEIKREEIWRKYGFGLLVIGFFLEIVGLIIELLVPKNI